MKGKRTVPSRSLPRRILLAGFALSFAMFCAFGWVLWYSFRNFEHTLEKEFRLMEVAGTIAHLDEALTMSANMAAATGDPRWEQRYNQHEPHLEEAIMEAVRLAPESFLREGASAVGTANARLMALEKQAFQAIREGRKRDAAALLCGDEYAGLKTHYKAALRHILVDLHDRAQREMRSNRKRGFLSVAAAVLAFPAFIYIWSRSLRKLDRYLAQRDIEADSLRRSEDKFATIFLANPDSVLLTRMADHTIVDVNESFTRQTGYTRDDVIGKTYEDIRYWVEKEQRDAFMQIMTTRGRCSDFEAVLRAKDGTRRPSLLAARLIRLEGEMCALVMARDITARKQAEEALRETERWEAIGAIAGGVAQNFSNIIQVIRSEATTIAGTLLPGTHAHASANSIIEAAQHGTELTERLLRVSQASHGTEDIPMAPVSVGRVVTESLELLEPLLKERLVVTDVKAPDTMPWVSANGTELVDIIMNVALNGADAMPGGGTIRIDTIERRIAHPRTNPNAEGGTFVGLRIRDEGAGMSKEVLDRIFEPFFTTKKSGSPFGLGLSVAQGTMMAMGGWMDVASKPGAGTVMRLFLHKTAPPMPTTAETDPLAGKTILLVDRDGDEIEKAVAALATEGCVARTAETVREGIAILDEEGMAPTVVVMHATLPRRDGSGLEEELRRKGISPAIVVTSGFSHDFVRGHFGRGRWTFLQKPYTAEQLVEAVARAITGPAGR